MIKAILIILVISIIGGAIYYYAFPYVLPKNADQAVTLTVWGVVDDDEIMNNVIVGFNKLHPNIKVVYAKQTLENYRTRVQSLVNSGQGGDVLALHSTWVPMFLQTKTISAAPASVINIDEVQNSFYPVVKQTMTQGGNVYALPNQMDGLILYYNKDILNAQALVVPTSWDILVSEATKTTVLSGVSGSTLKTAGAPLGGYENFSSWPQIVGLLFMEQPDVSVLTPDNASGQEVVSFYNMPNGTIASGGNAKRIWSADFADATQAFADGNLTFLFAPASAAPDIKRKNPKLNFGTSTMPELPSKTVNFACFWGYGVSSKSSHQNEAWQFVKFLTDAETQKYRIEQENQKFGGSTISPRVDMASQFASDPILGPIAKEAPTLRSFPLCPGTKDNGLNDDMIGAFESGMKNGDLKTLQTQIQKILPQYNATSFQIP